MASIKSKIESILFVSNKPIGIGKLAELSNSKKDEVEKAITELVEEYDNKAGGVRIMRDKSSYQMITSAENSDLIKEMLKDETTKELTKPSLETLTIIAYRGPISKLQIEQIRGVNCSLILRNLMIRGLVEMKEEKGTGMPIYSVTFDFMRYLGVSSIEQLPEYEKLHANDSINKLLEIESKENDQEKNSIPV